MDQEAVDGSDYMSNSDMNGLVRPRFTIKLIEKYGYIYQSIVWNQTSMECFV